MLLQSAPILPPFAVVLALAAAGRTVALETWRANRERLVSAERVIPDGPAGVASEEVERAWLDLADWHAWWDLNDDPYLALKAHVHVGAVLTGSDAFFLGHGQAGPSGPSTPGPVPTAGGGTARRLPDATLGPGAGTTGCFHSSAPERPWESDPLLFLPRSNDLEENVRRVSERILESCTPLPGESPRDLHFRFWSANPFVSTRTDPLSTFAADVDAASYALTRRHLRSGLRPARELVRTEEFVNAFSADAPAPLEGTFAVHAELAPSRFGTDSQAFRAGRVAERWMLRVAIRGREVAPHERPPLALTWVVDTSGSMEREGRIELVRRALHLVLDQLDARDTVSIVSFATQAELVLPPTPASDRRAVGAALARLVPVGNTNAEAGLRMAYRLARDGHSPRVHSRVVLLSDGIANVGATSGERLAAAVSEQREAGILLNTVGVGMDGYDDRLLEQLANLGDGICTYLDDEEEARRALVDGFAGSFVAIARDLKVQVEFDPEQVARYRLLGYENRVLADAEFRDDAVDAGEVGAGHQVTALYELELARASSAPLATVRLRWKPPVRASADPADDPAVELAAPIRFAGASSWESSSPGYQRSVIAAQLAELLRSSVHARDDSLEELAIEATRLEPGLRDPAFTELAELARLALANHPPPMAPHELRACAEDLRHRRYAAALRAADGIALDPAVRAGLEREEAALEARIDAIVRERIAAHR